MDEPGPQSSAGEIVEYLRSLSRAENVAGMARYGIDTSTALGIPNAVLRPLARGIKRDHDRALALWDTGIREARLLALFTDEKKKVTADQARAWAADFNSWEIVDHAADLFVDAGLGPTLIEEFADDEREFVRRCAFAMIAWSAVHEKKKPDAEFLPLLDLIDSHAGDPRNFVKKAVNWALRQIGKRSIALHEPALALAGKLAASDDKARRWVGRGAQKELNDEKTLARLAK